MISGVGIDWLEGYVPSESLGSVWSLFKLHTQLEGVEVTPFKPYTHRFKWADGWEVSIKHDEGLSRAVDSGLVVLRGAAFVGRSLDDVHALCCALASLSFDCKRLDVRYDDGAKLISPTSLYFDYVQRGCASGPASRRYVETSEGGGASAYFGRRGSEGSGVETVIYDKWAQSGGEIDAVRWETRYWRKKAPQVWEYLNPVVLDDSVPLTDAEFVSRLGTLVGSNVEFWQDAEDKNLSRRRHAPWWAQIREALGPGATFLGGAS